MAQALQAVRRLADMGDRYAVPNYLLLLDWEKAFDKVTRPGLFSALDRINVPAQLKSHPVHLF